MAVSFPLSATTPHWDAHGCSRILRMTIWKVCVVRQR